MNKIVCFGELLLRLSPALDQRWIKQNNSSLYVGGAELNVARALAHWNVPTKYCTTLPDNYLTREIIQELNDRSIDTSSVHLSGDRIGLYYLPQGADMKNAGVIYDRLYSSFSNLKPGMINWNDVFKDCNWFHFSAISPALNRNIAAVCIEAVQVAAAKKMVISIDLNYREQLWKYGASPLDVMPELVQYCDVVMGNLWAVENLLGLRSSIKDSIGKSTSELLDAAEYSMKRLQRDYPNISQTAFTFRLQESYFGVLRQGMLTTVSEEFSLRNVIDRVGSGDCFMGGLIYSVLNKKTPKDCIDFAVASAVGKLKERGDVTNNCVEQIQMILTNND